MFSLFYICFIIHLHITVFILFLVFYHLTFLFLFFLLHSLYDIESASPSPLKKRRKKITIIIIIIIIIITNYLSSTSPEVPDCDRNLI